LTYTLTLPLSGVLSLYAVLLNEPNGNMFFVEYFTRLCLNVALFSISCWGEAVEMPQQLLFTIVLYINVIFFIGIMATLSKEILYTSSVPQNVLSMHHTDLKKGIFFLPGMSPKISQKDMDIIFLGEGNCGQTSSDDLEVIDSETTKKHNTDPKKKIFFLPGKSSKIKQKDIDIILYGEGDCSQTPSDDLEVVYSETTKKHHTDPKKKIFFLPGKSSKIRQKAMENILYGEGDCSQTPSDELVVADSDTTESVAAANFTIAEHKSVKTEPKSNECLVAENFAIAGDESSLFVDVTSSSTSWFQKVAHFLKKTKNPR